MLSWFNTVLLGSASLDCFVLLLKSLKNGPLRLLQKNGNNDYRVEVGALAWSCDHAGAPKSILTQGDLEFGALAWSYLKSINDHARAPRSRSPWVSMDFGAPEWSDFLIYPVLSFMNNDHARAPRSILCTVVWKLVPS